jgi:uncharacterized protein (UPF0305 family)
MKQQGNSSHSKATSTAKYLNNSEKEEISNIDLQKIIVRKINDLKEEMHKQVSEFKEIMNKQLKELNRIQRNR